jgi:DNA-directed RNA polymerase subunit K/omega
VLPTASKKPTVIAMEESRRGLVKYDLIVPTPPAAEPAPEAVL